jgi:hypothetical protein
MLDKLHRFSTSELDPDERGILGALMAPGIQWALEQSAGDDEVAAFGLVVWTPESLANGAGPWRPDRGRAPKVEIRRRPPKAAFACA